MVSFHDARDDPFDEVVELLDSWEVPPVGRRRPSTPSINAIGPLTVVVAAGACTCSTIGIGF